MEDSRIVELYWQRSEAALEETERKYGRWCFSIARNILLDDEDARECVNDTYLGAWNSMPPHRPEALRAYLGKIARRVSLNKLRGRHALRRGGGAAELSLEELEECVPSGRSIDEGVEAARLAEIINGFLETLPAEERRIFLRRYWYFDPISDIAARFGYGESKVKMKLKRTRDKLLECLREEDVWI